MSATRKPFRREGEDRRRADLVAAALAVIAEGGIEAATVRAIALRAGVTPGLIGHYFPGKDDLLRTAYGAIMADLAAAARAALADCPGTPLDRLLAFVAANLSPPVADARTLSLWAGFISRVHADPAFAAIHRDTYLSFRAEIADLLMPVLAAEGRVPAEGELVEKATAINAVIDGLWLEASLAPGLFGAGGLERAGRMAVAAIVGGAAAREG